MNTYKVTFKKNIITEKDDFMLVTRRIRASNEKQALKEAGLIPNTNEFKITACVKV